MVFFEHRLSFGQASLTGGGYMLPKKYLIKGKGTKMKKRMRSNMRKRILSRILVVCMMFTMLPTLLPDVALAVEPTNETLGGFTATYGDSTSPAAVALAAEPITEELGGFTVTYDGSTSPASFDDGILTVTGDCTIKSGETTDRIVVNAAEPVTITLAGVNINCSNTYTGPSSVAALTTSGGAVTLNVIADSTLTGGRNGGTGIFGDVIVSGIAQLTVNGEGNSGTDRNGSDGGVGIYGNVTVSGIAQLTVNGGGGNFGTGLNGGNGGVGIYGNVTVSGIAQLTANGGGGGGSTDSYCGGNGGAGISGNVTISDAAQLSAKGGGCGVGSRNGANGSAIGGTITKPNNLVENRVLDIYGDCITIKLPTAQDYAKDAANGTDYNIIGDDTLVIRTAKGAAWWNWKSADYSQAKYRIWLEADIDVSDFFWSPVGTSSSPFMGTFEAYGHKITGLTVNTRSTGGGLNNDTVCGGLFGRTSGAAIKNVCVSGTMTAAGDFKGSDDNVYVGGIVGYANDNSTITNCCSHSVLSGSITDDTYGGGIYVGGIVGNSSDTTISNCFNNGRVATAYSVSGTVTTYTGGISAQQSGGSITNCYNTGAVTTATYTGGITGDVLNTVTLTNCYYLTATGRPSKGIGNGSAIASGCGSFMGIESNLVAGTTDQFGGTEVQTLADYANEKPLLDALKGWVSAQNSTNYTTWEIKAGTNSGYPVFGPCSSGKTAPTVGTLIINDLFHADDTLNAYQFASYKPTMEDTDYVVTGEGWQFATVSTGATPQEGDWSSLESLKVNVTQDHYLRYYTKYNDGTNKYVYSNAVKLKVLISAYTYAQGAESGIDYEDKSYIDFNSDGSLKQVGIMHIKTAKGAAWFSSMDRDTFDNRYKCFKNYTIYLDADIDVSSFFWEPIGYINKSSYFMGTFDGQGHTIKGLTVQKTIFDNNKYAAGMFGYSSGSVKNVKLKNVLVTSYYADSNKLSPAICAGGIVGFNDGSVFGCVVTGNITATNVKAPSKAYAGGIAGYNNGGVLLCVNSSSVNANTYTYSMYEDVGAVAGGIVGYNDGGIGSSTNSGSIVANGHSWLYAGGISGVSCAGITNSYNIGSVNANGNDTNNSFAGGIVGRMALNLTYPYIKNCYNIGSIAATPGYCGGVVGWVGTDGLVMNVNHCYYLNNVANYGYGYKQHSPIPSYVQVFQYCGIFNDSSNSSNQLTAGSKEFDSEQTLIYGGNLLNALNAWVDKETFPPDIKYLWEIRDGVNQGYPVLTNLPTLIGNDQGGGEGEATAPAITTDKLPDGVVGTAYSQTLAATGTTPITWSVAGSLPDGLIINENTGEITGTPTAVGTYCFTVKAENSKGSDTKELSFIVNSPLRITWTNMVSYDLDFGSVLEGYTTTPDVQTVYLYNISADTITISQPASPNYDIGTLSNTTLGAYEIVTFTIKPKTGLKAMNYDTIIPIMNDNYNYENITVKFSVMSPTLTSPIITTNNLADGVIGTTYSQTLAATGTTPIIWSVDGSLPDGLNLDTDTGAITGTPTATGTFNFTVKATNTSGSDTKTLSITVTLPITSVSVDPATATVKKTKTQQFTANVSGTSTNKSVTWSVIGGSKSTIDSNGLLTVSGMETATTLTVKATSTVDSTKFGTATVTVIAAPKICTVTFDSDGGSSVDPISGIEEGKTIKLPNVPTKACCRFDGWYTAKNGSGTMFTDSTTVNNSITVYAKWTKLVTVAGTVVNYDNTPIAGASVSLEPTYGSSTQVTDAQGKFSFGSIPEDVFTATAKFSDSSTVLVNVTGDYGNVKIVKPKPYITITTQPQDATIIKGIAGQSATFNVLGTRTPYIANSIAYEWWWLKGATPAGTTPDERMTGNGSQMTLNQDNGNIPGRGTYKLYAYAYDSDAAIDAYSRVATLKVVGINTIEGVVKNADNTPVNVAKVELVYAGGAWPYGSVALTTSTNPQTTKADGSYKFDTVPDGKYRLVITLPSGGQITYGPYDFPGSNPDPVKPIDPGIVIPAAPSIQVSGQPQDATVKNDTAVTLSVDAGSTDGTALTYQWYSNTKNSNTGGTKIEGATSASYTPATANKGITYYYCVVTGDNLDPVTTRAAKITVYTYGIIAGTVQNKDKNPIDGAKVELINIDTPMKTGFTTSANPQTTVADGKYKFIEVPDGQYKLKVTMPSGEIFVVQPINVPNVNPNIQVTPPDKPTISITSQPKSMTVALHDTAEFTVNAGVSDNGTVLYQWYSNTADNTTGGTAIDGATAATYHASTDTKGITYYYCVIQANGAEAITSNIVKLTVRNMPVNNIVTIEGNVVDNKTPAQPVEGAVVTLSPKTGTSANPQTTGSNGHYKFENLPDGKYTITVKLPSGGVIVQEIVIEDGEITPTPPNNISVPTTNSITITQQPTDIEVTTEMGAAFTVKSTATKDNVSYQWYKNTTNASSGGTKLDGKTDGTLTLDKQAEGVTYYYCVISSTGAADKVTNVAKLTVTKAGDNKGDLEGGIVSDNDGKPVADASVKLMKKGTDGTQFGSTVITGEDGKFAFTAIPYGSYSLVAQKDAQIITRQIAIKSTKTTENLILPSGGKLTKVIINGSNTPSVAIGNLEEMFTTVDNAIAKQAGVQVEIKLIVQQKDAPANKAQIDSALTQHQKIGIYLDATLVKTIRGTRDGDITQSIQPPDGQTLRVVLDIPRELQGKSGYKVIRAHSENGLTDTKLIDPAYDSDLQTLSFDADAFSTYAIVYTQVQKYNMTVNGSGAGSSSGTGLYEAGSTVTIKAGTKSGYSFDGWTSSDGVTFANASDATTTFTMLAKSITVTANWKSNSGSDNGGGNGGGNNGGGSNDSGSNGSSPSYDYYTITAIAGEGGSISPSGSISVGKGLSKTFTITSSSGYVISDLIIDGKSVGAKNSYTFEKVYTNHSIKAEFKKTENVNPSTGVNFEDVNENDWFYKDVMNAIENGWFKGTSSTKFSPYLSTERGMIATVIWNMEEQPKPINTSIFKDVPADAWFHDGVTWANENNEIVKGYGNGLFGPKDNITREQMVSILYRYAAFKGYNISGKTSLNGFKDGNKTSDCFVDAMQWAVANGLLTGKGNGILDPKGHATRAEVAVILVKFDKLFKE